MGSRVHSRVEVHVRCVEDTLDLCGHVVIGVVLGSPRRRNTTCRVLAKLLLILGVVFTPSVGYSRPLSAVNDLSVPIAIESFENHTLMIVFQVRQPSGFPGHSALETSSW